METIEYNDLEFIDIFDWAEGAYSYNRRCTYNGQIYVCKTFKDNNYLKGRKRKLNLISEIDNPRLITPKFWVKKSGKTNQYLCPYYEGENIEKLKLKPDINTTIKILLDAKNAILSMHQNKIIHSDAHDQNIIYNGTDTRILDLTNVFTYYNKLDGNTYPLCFDPLCDHNSITCTQYLFSDCSAIYSKLDNRIYIGRGDCIFSMNFNQI